MCVHDTLHGDVRGLAFVLAHRVFAVGRRLSRRSAFVATRHGNLLFLFCTPGQRAPPWAFTLHRGCSHIPHNVSAHALSSPRGIGILAPAPRCDLRAGGRRTRGRTPTHTLATHRVRTRRARGTLAGSSRSSSLCTTSQQPPRLRAGGCRYPRWAAVLRPRLRGHERRVPRGPRPFTTHVTLSHPTYGAAGRRASFGSLPFASLSATSLA